MIRVDHAKSVTFKLGSDDLSRAVAEYIMSRYHLGVDSVSTVVKLSATGILSGNASFSASVNVPTDPEKVLAKF